MEWSDLDDVCKKVCVAFPDIVRVQYELGMYMGQHRFYTFVIDLKEQVGVWNSRKYVHYERNQLGKWESKEWYIKDICERAKKFFRILRIKDRRRQ